MLTHSLPFIEGEEGDGSHRAFNQRPTDDGSLLVIHKVYHADDFHYGHFALPL